MRNLVVCNIMSIDGFHEGPKKNVMDVFAYRWDSYPKDDSFDRYCAQRLRAADTLLVGRTTYDQLKGYWPRVAADPKASPTEREISRRNNSIQKVVVSNTLTADQTEPWRQSTRILRREDVYSKIARLKRKAGKEILMVGSRTLWNDLLAYDLVDELHLLIGPTVAGGGTPAFDGRPPVSLRLIDTKTWNGAGTVLVRYEVHPRK